MKVNIVLLIINILATLPELLNVWLVAVKINNT